MGNNSQQVSYQWLKYGWTWQNAVPPPLVFSPKHSQTFKFPKYAVKGPKPPTEARSQTLYLYQRPLYFLLFLR